MARGRNAGFRRLLERMPEIELVQFLDGDCELQPRWLDQGRLAMQQHPDAAVVSGRRRERDRNANVYHRLMDMEWDTPIGEVDACHGDAMMRVSFLRKAGLFDESLIAGEEPELCTRLRGAGGRILRLPAEMSLHDAAIDGFRTWWRRCLRSGHAEAQCAARHGWRRDRSAIRALVRPWLWVFCVPLALGLATLSLGAVALAGFLVYPLHAAKIALARRRRGDSLADSALYALFVLIGRVPTWLGHLSYWTHAPARKALCADRVQEGAGRDVKVAVVGAGRIAEQHLRVLTQIEGLEVGVCDRSPAAAEFAAERFALPRYSDDFATLLDEMRPDVVHVTTPVDAHVALARQALARGAHVLVEKPIAPSHADWLGLREAADSAQRWVMEDQPYPFSPPVQRVLREIESGRFGDVVHVDAMISLEIFAPGSAFADAHAPHPSHAQPGGPISDFLTHLASICVQLVGRHVSSRALWHKRNAKTAAPFDELRALVEAERGTASLGFSANARPDAFAVRVFGTKMSASMSLFEGALCLQRRRPGASAWTPLVNGIDASWSHGADALRSLRAKLAGRPLVHEGLRELIRRFYTALRTGAPAPIGPDQIDAVSRLVRDLTAELPGT